MPGRYLNLSKNELQTRVQTALDLLDSCVVCPRQCQVNRLENERGFCQTGRWAQVASYNLHFGEEAPLVGDNGSGTIFFAHCNLGCVFCQNWDISHSEQDFKPVGAEELARIMLKLQEQGAHNINLVTPSHVVPQILEALPVAIQQGLKLPLVYNSGGYDAVSTLQLLEGIVDIYMPDTKFSDPRVAKRLCLAENYPQCAQKAIREMHRQTGDLQLDQSGIATQGLLIRHLVLPAGQAGTEEWMRFLAQEISTNTYINIMDQYHPSGRAGQYPEINSTLSPEEYENALQTAKSYSLNRLDERHKNRLAFRLKNLLR